MNNQKYDNVLVGTALYDDAGVVRISDDLALVTTVDYFTPVVDDAFDFGAIAAANSLSDIYAMGARPISALNIVGFPEKNIPIEILKEIMNGGLSIAKQAGMPIVGGHTIKAPEPFYGMSITGVINPKKIMANSTARDGDRLYLTKPLGTGVITTAHKNGKADDKTVAAAVAIMKELNRAASEAVLSVCASESSYICSATDITGYGFLGHLSEMLLGSDSSAVIDFSKIPTIPGALNLAEKDLFPGGSRSNLLSVEPDMLWDRDFEKYEKLLLADAQTSGGLLIAVKPDLADKLEAQMKNRGLNFAMIGEITKREKWLIKVIKN